MRYRRSSLDWLLLGSLTLLLLGCRSPSRRAERSDAAAPPPSQAATTEEPGESLRRAFLVHDGSDLKRKADLVAQKYAKMSRTPFAFFRGTAWMSRDGASRFKTPASSQLAIVGDPHPENVGTFLDAGGQLVLEFNDFDLAGYGSYIDDLRRLAVGIGIVASMAELTPAKQAAAVTAAVVGYQAQVGALARGQAAMILHANQLGEKLDQLLTKPDTEPADVLDASPDEVSLATAIVGEYSKSVVHRAPFVIKRVTALSSGVASFSALRLRVVLRETAVANDDDITIEIKASASPNVAAVIAIQRQFHEPLQADAWLGSVLIDERAFLVRRVSSIERRISAKRFAKRIERGHSNELEELASAFGALLARGHCVALDRNGKPGLSAMTAALEAGPGLAEETVAHAASEVKLNEARFSVFRDLLVSRGPTLGWSPSP